MNSEYYFHDPLLTIRELPFEQSDDHQRMHDRILMGNRQSRTPNVQYFPSPSHRSKANSLYQQSHGMEEDPIYYGFSAIKSSLVQSSKEEDLNKNSTPRNESSDFNGYYSPFFTYSPTIFGTGNEVKTGKKIREKDC